MSTRTSDKWSIACMGIWQAVVNTNFTSVSFTFYLTCTSFATSVIFSLLFSSFKLSLCFLPRSWTLITANFGISSDLQTLHQLFREPDLHGLSQGNCFSHDFKCFLWLSYVLLADSILAFLTKVTVLHLTRLTTFPAVNINIAKPALTMTSFKAYIHFIVSPHQCLN